MDSNKLRAMWRDAGGSFHGPNIETGTMPESKLLPLLARLAEAEWERDAYRAALESIAKEESPARAMVAGGFHNTTFAIDLAGRAGMALRATGSATGSK